MYHFGCFCFWNLRCRLLCLRFWSSDYSVLRFLVLISPRSRPGPRPRVWRYKSEPMNVTQNHTITVNQTDRPSKDSLTVLPHHKTRKPPRQPNNKWTLDQSTVKLTKLNTVPTHRCYQNQSPHFRPGSGWHWIWKIWTQISCWSAGWQVLRSGRFSSIRWEWIQSPSFILLRSLNHMSII
jgi:hypothetical protein